MTKYNTEEWKDITGYDGRYSVSNKGRLRRNEWTVETTDGRLITYKEMIMSTPPNKDGYPIANLTKDKKRRTVRVHRIVAKEFVDNPNNYIEVNHIDEVKDNNNADNLEWCTRQHNMIHGTGMERMQSHPNQIARHEVSKKPVVAIDISTLEVASYESMSSAERSGFKRRNIWSVINGYERTHKNKVWLYVEDYTPGQEENIVVSTLPPKTIQLDDDRKVVAIYDSSLIAGKEVGVHPSNISRAIKNNRKSAGYYWEYRKVLNVEKGCQK